MFNFQEKGICPFWPCKSCSIIYCNLIYILSSREMMDFAIIIVKYLKPSLVDSLMVLLSKLVYGDYTKNGIRRPKEGPSYLKRMCGKYPLIDVGICKKIKSREIQVKSFEWENGWCLKKMCKSCVVHLHV